MPPEHTNVEPVAQRRVLMDDVVANSAEGTKFCQLNGDQEMRLKLWMGRLSENGFLERYSEFLGQPPGFEQYMENSDKIDRLYKKSKDKTLLDLLRFFSEDPALKPEVEIILLNTPEYRLKAMKRRQEEAVSELIPHLKKSLEGAGDVQIVLVGRAKRDKHVLSILEEKLNGLIPVVFYVRRVKAEGFLARRFKRQPTVIDQEKLNQGEPRTVKQHLKNCFNNGTPVVLYLSENLEPALNRREPFKDGGNLIWMLNQLQANSELEHPTSEVMLPVYSKSGPATMVPIISENFTLISEVYCS